MAATARCLRSLSRSSVAKHVSPYITRTTSKSPSSSAPLLRSFLRTEAGLLNGARTVGISGRINFSKRFAPASFVCSMPKVCSLSMETCGEISDGSDGNVGDDDGDTWSQDDEPYLHDT